MYLAYSIRERALLVLYNEVIVSLPDHAAPAGRRFRQNLIRRSTGTSANERRRAHHCPAARRLTWCDKVPFLQVSWDAALRHGVVVDDEVVE